jgi:hypothetical protein
VGRWIFPGGLCHAASCEAGLPQWAVNRSGQSQKNLGRCDVLRSELVERGAVCLLMKHSFLHQLASAMVTITFCAAMLIAAQTFVAYKNAKLWDSRALQLAAMKRPPT